MTPRTPTRPHAKHAHALRLAALACAILVTATTLHALDVPYLSGRINDHAGLLSASTVQSLEAKLKAYEDSTGNQIAVLILPSLEGESLEEYSLRVAETWKLGKKGKDNGVLLLIAKGDRKLRIEAGYGLEASLTDAVCSYIINSEITPHFKSGDFDAGVTAGVDAIIRAADGTLDMKAASGGGSSDLAGTLMFAVIWFSVVGIFTLIVLFTEGCSSWFLYAFLIPFYAAGSFVLVDAIGWSALIIFVVYLVGMPIAKIVLAKSAFGKRLKDKFHITTSGGRTMIGGWAIGGGSSSGGWSGGGGGFSGGGGSFGGGGSSGSW